MIERQDEGQSRGWTEELGLRHIIRIPAMALQPSKLGFALAGILLTFALGGILDMVWVSAGAGVEEDAIEQFIMQRRAGGEMVAGALDVEVEPGAEVLTARRGVFDVWRRYEAQAVVGFLITSLPGQSLAESSPVWAYIQAQEPVSPLGHLARLAYGGWWMVHERPLYAVLFGLLGLLIWSWAGGALCRMTAVQMARDERISTSRADGFARTHWSAFYLAPCIPLAMALAIMFLLALGGLLLRIPLLGDVVMGLAFPLAIVGGLAIALLCLGWVVGGSLYWPAVAVDGVDAFDAFARGISYTLTKPWKTLIYVALTTILAGFCWLVANLFTFVLLGATRGVVGFGTSPFGLFPRGDGSKIDLLWPMPETANLHVWPVWSQLSWYESISAALIGCCVLLVLAVMWSFLASYYYVGATVLYTLLRRDVDAIDLEELYIVEGEGVELPNPVGTEADEAAEEAPGEATPGGE